MLENVTEKDGCKGHLTFKSCQERCHPCIQRPSSQPLLTYHTIWYMAICTMPAGVYEERLHQLHLNLAVR